MGTEPQPAPKPEAVLTTWEQFKFWFLTNRAKIGSFAFAVIGLLRVTFNFPHEEEWSRVLLTALDFLGAGSAAIAASGAFKSDEYHEQQKQAVIRERSGEFAPVLPFERRRDDAPGTTQDMPAVNDADAKKGP